MKENVYIKNNNHFPWWSSHYNKLEFEGIKPNGDNINAETLETGQHSFAEKHGDKIIYNILLLNENKWKNTDTDSETTKFLESEK